MKTRLVVRLLSAIAATSSLSLSSCEPAAEGHQQSTGTPVPPASGSIEGNVFLRMQNGDTKPGTGLTIKLVRNVDSLTSEFGRICVAYETRHTVLRREQIAAFRKKQELDDGFEAASVREQKAVDAQIEHNAATFDAIGNLLRSSTAAVSRTGMDAHFKFDSVASGRYRLAARWSIGERTHWFWAPVVVLVGKRIVMDLDNEAVQMGQRLFCGVVDATKQPPLWW